jgi:hypothetical protein
MTRLSCKKLKMENWKQAVPIRKDEPDKNVIRLTDFGECLIELTPARVINNIFETRSCR